MTSSEIVKALREDCKTCSENSVCRNGLNLAGLYCANKDAADLIERLEKEKAEQCCGLPVTVTHWAPMPEAPEDEEK